MYIFWFNQLRAGVVRTIKRITAWKIVEASPEVKKMVWGGELWTGG
jgi:hypothetical protein